MFPLGYARTPLWPYVTASNGAFANPLREGALRALACSPPPYRLTTAKSTLRGRKAARKPMVKPARTGKVCFAKPRLPRHTKPGKDPRSCPKATNPKDAHPTKCFVTLRTTVGLSLPPCILLRKAARHEHQRPFGAGPPRDRQGSFGRFLHNHRRRA